MLIIGKVVNTLFICFQLKYMAACRICYEPDDLISVCQCTGTAGKVHLKCIQQWINVSKNDKCEICKTEYTHPAIQYTHTAVQTDSAYTQRTFLACGMISFILGILHGVTICIDNYYGTLPIITAALSASVFNCAQCLNAIGVWSFRKKYWKMHTFFYSGFVASSLILGVFALHAYYEHILYTYTINTVIFVGVVAHEIQINTLAHNDQI